MRVPTLHGLERCTCALGALGPGPEPQVRTQLVSRVRRSTHRPSAECSLRNTRPIPAATRTPVTFARSLIYPLQPTSAHVGREAARIRTHADSRLRSRGPFVVRARFTAGMACRRRLKPCCCLDQQRPCASVISVTTPCRNARQAHHHC
jgi:hypothetical protein